MTSKSQKHAEMPPYPRRPVVRAIKFIVSIFVYGIVGVWRGLARTFGVKGQGTRVGIFYHQVLPSELSRFQAQMDHLRKVAVPVSADELGPIALGSRAVFVTADDAWKSFADNAVPELVKRGIPCTIFAIAGRLGESLGETDDRIVLAAELQRLPSSLITIGSHTLTHPNMTALSNSDALYELAESRKLLGELLGTEVSFFCPPFGAADARIFELCRQAGYRHLYMSRLVNSPDNFVLGRIRADPNDWKFEFHLKLVGAYNWVPWSINLKAYLRSWLKSLRSTRRTPSIPLHDELADSDIAGDIPDRSMTKLG